MMKLNKKLVNVTLGLIVTLSTGMSVLPNAASAATYTNKNQQASGSADRLIQDGLKYLGTPYHFGANRNSTSSFDCSSFTHHIYQEALGINITGNSRSQAAYAQAHGQIIYNMNQLQKGDLMFFGSYGGNKSRITHVGIYMGNGKILQTWGRGGVRVDNFSGSWKSRFIKGGRILN